MEACKTWMEKGRVDKTAYLTFSLTWTSCGGSVTVALINRGSSLQSALLPVSQDSCVDVVVKDCADDFPVLTE